MRLSCAWYVCLCWGTVACGTTSLTGDDIPEAGPASDYDGAVPVRTTPGDTPGSPDVTFDAQSVEDARATLVDGGCIRGTVCGSDCADTNSDPNNCGACSRTCSAGQVCSNGLCQASCGPGLVGCGGACVDFNTNSADCGKCGAACGEGFRCTGGTCTCPGSVCHSQCTDITEDPANCGGCGYGCPSGSPPPIVGDEEALAVMPVARYCNLGLCSLYCSLGTNLCGLSCVHTEVDDNNCGRCGVVCPGGSTCQQGACVCANGAETVCDGLCVDTQTSSAHCGGCDAPCPEGVACMQGTCAVACPDDTTACGNSCVDLMTTKEHCGLCNQVCEGNLVCTGGHCTCPPGWMQCGGSCVELADGGGCP
jgi:hypothetical protein